MSEFERFVITAGEPYRNRAADLLVETAGHLRMGELELADKAKGNAEQQLVLTHSIERVIPEIFQLLSKEGIDPTEFFKSIGRVLLEDELVAQASPPKKAKKKSESGEAGQPPKIEKQGSSLSADSLGIKSRGIEKRIIDKALQASKEQPVLRSMLQEVAYPGVDLSLAEARFKTSFVKAKKKLKDAGVILVKVTSYANHKKELSYYSKGAISPHQQKEETAEPLVNNQVEPVFPQVQITAEDLANIEQQVEKELREEAEASVVDDADGKQQANISEEDLKFDPDEDDEFGTEDTPRL